MIIRGEHRQGGHRVRLEWGVEGVGLLAADCAAVVIVDVLSFCTAVDVALGRGAVVLPQRTTDPDAAARAAAAAGAVPGGDRFGRGPSLRPSSLTALAPGTRIALRSPNGATLCAAARDTILTHPAGSAGCHPPAHTHPAGSVGCHPRVFAGCLRNASAVAAALRGIDGPIGLVPAGERWPDGTMRVALEDALGAGAIAAALEDRSPEADAAVDLFLAARTRGLRAVLGGCAGGRELIADGFAADVDLAADLDVSPAVPELHGPMISDRGR